MTKEGKKFDIPFIYEKYIPNWDRDEEKYSFGQEGRHRSIKNSVMGLETIKVDYIKTVDIPSKIGMEKYIQSDIVNKFRKNKEIELGWENNNKCFTGKCDTFSHKLVNKLNKNGIESYVVSGFYLNIESEFSPSSEFFDNSEEEEIDEFYEVLDEGNDYWNHWLIYTDNDTSIDITADQFYNEPENHRIKIFGPNDNEIKNYEIYQTLNIESLRKEVGKPKSSIDMLNENIDKKRKGFIESVLTKEENLKLDKILGLNF